MSTLGFSLFEKPSELPKVGGLYFCTAAGTDARAQYTPEGMVVLKGSKARLGVTDSFKGKPFFATRQKLQDAGILQTVGDTAVFTQDYVFKSPSSAAAIIVGNNMNGYLVQAGPVRVVDEVVVERQQLGLLLGSWRGLTGAH